MQFDPRSGDTQPFSFLLILIFFLTSFLLLPASQALGGETIPEKPLEKSQYHPKVETQLNLLSTAARKGRRGAAREAARAAGITFTTSNSVMVILEEKSAGMVSPASIRAQGGKVLGKTGNLKKVQIPAERILDLANELEGVSYIRSPLSPTIWNENSSVSGSLSGSPYDSTGPNLTGASRYHTRNYLGQGVNVAVIDLGFGSLALAQDAGVLPEEAIADTEDYTGSEVTSGTAHGTAVAEIVHAMAPEADLYLKKISDEVDLGRATSDAISQGIDIIVHSVGWLNTNFGDGSGPIADIARKAINAGILWVNAAGNSARRHWQGPARDEDRDGWLEFKPNKENIEIKNELGQEIGLYLTWNDWPETNRDLDLFLYDGEGNLVSSSQNYQTGSEPPTEQLSFSPSDSGKYYLKVSGPADLGGLELEIFSLDHQLKPNVEENSIMAPGNVEQVFTVGAVNENNWVHGPIEPFSSRGPTEDGRIKPDLAGINGITLYTYRSFLGTSAAAPSAAGAGALILSRSPEIDQSELKKALQENAKDLGPFGDDNIYGSGRMRLIAETASGTRKVKNKSDGGISPGGDFTVNLTAKMPLSLQGGLTVKESVPEPLLIKEVVKPKSAVLKNSTKLKSDWKIVEAGAKKELIYRVSVPENLPPGKYEITGSINGNSIEATSIEVLGTNNTGEQEGLSLKETEAIMDGPSSRVKFRAVGENLHRIKVKVYALSGKKVFDSGWRDGNTFQWNLQNKEGESVPNGVYLYFVQVKGSDGETTRSEVNKTLVLR